MVKRSSNSLFILLPLGMASFLTSLPVMAEEIPKELKPWLTSQSWQRDTETPILSLGKSGQF